MSQRSGGQKAAVSATEMSPPWTQPGTGWLRNPRLQATSWPRGRGTQFVAVSGSTPCFDRRLQAVPLFGHEFRVIVVFCVFLSPLPFGTSFARRPFLSTHLPPHALDIQWEPQKHAAGLPFPTEFLGNPPWNPWYPQSARVKTMKLPSSWDAPNAQGLGSHEKSTPHQVGVGL